MPRARPQHGAGTPAASQHQPGATPGSPHHPPPALPSVTHGRVAAVTGALALLLLLAVGWPVASRISFDARAEPGWAVVQSVLGGTVRAVHDADPDGPTFELDMDGVPVSSGQRVAVRYDPQDPQRVAPAASSVWRVEILVGGVVGVALGAVALSAAILGRRGPG